ncbi:hypothetical protein [Krasilnikovia sp. MM14-A1259]|uniref:hypothetical protein n=1 Tax=Krasilnikovia sp. MM14-A1259 TaxID=3373539 RepID=UPI0037FF89EF
MTTETTAGREPEPQWDIIELGSTPGGRGSRRRTVLLGGSVALALAAAVTVPMLRSGESGKPSPPHTPVTVAAPNTPAPVSTTPTTPPSALPSATPSTAAPVVWVKPRWANPTFPLTAGWSPAGAGQPRVLKIGPNVALHYEWSGSVLSAEVGPVPGSWEVEAQETHAGTVGGRRATIRTADKFDPGSEGSYVGIRWRLADGRWVQVLSFGALTETQVRRFADNLRPGSMTTALPFTVAEVPAGLTLQFQGPAMMCLAPSKQTSAAAGDDESATQPRGLCLSVAKESFPSTSANNVLQVGDRRAVFGAGAPSLTVDLGAGQVLKVEWDPEQTPLTPDDAVRFAAGVRVNHPSGTKAG